MENANGIVVNWPTVLAYLASALAPAIVGFLQQFSKKFSETTPWYLKGLVTSAIGAFMTVTVSWLANAEASVAAGAVLATVGSVNIALRKGTRSNLESIREQRVELAVAKFAEVNNCAPDKKEDI
jgi:hypothetical protein